MISRSIDATFKMWPRATSGRVISRGGRGAER